MKLLTTIRALFAAALLAFAPVPALASQATYAMPTAGPHSMADLTTNYFNPAFAAILSCNSGATAPAVSGQPATFECWINTSTTPRQIEIYDGSQWLVEGYIDTSGHTYSPNGSKLTLLGSSSGTVTIIPQATAGTPTLTAPNASGTFAVNASSPLVLSATTGNLTCPTCATSTSGGSITGVGVVAVSSGGAISITGAAGQVLAGSTPAFTATPTLGVAGSTLGTLTLAGSTSGTTTLQPNVAASGTLTLPAATDTLIGKATTDTLTGKTLDTAGAGNSLLINGLAATANTGTGAVARAAGPTFTTPILGAATATTVNKVTITQPATGSTLTIADGKTATVNNSLTLAGTDSTTMTFPSTSATIARTDAANTFTGHQTIEGVTSTGATGTGKFVFDTAPTIGLSNGTGLPVSTGISGLGAGIAAWLATPSSANLATALTDETGSGAAVFGTTPTIATPVLNGLPTGTGVASAATASTLASRDASANISANAFLVGYATTATAAGTTTLVVGSPQLQFFTGSTTQTVVLPVASTLVLGQSWTIVNNSSGTVTVQSSGANTILAVAAGNTGIFTAVLTSGTSAASWSSTYISSGAGTGTVTSVTCNGGLSGGTITTTGTCAISAGGVTYSMLASAALATSGNYQANAASTVLGPNAVWSAAGTTALTDAATIAVDMSTGINFTVTLGGNRTLGAPSNTKVGQSGVFRVTQDGTGTRTLAYNAVYKWSGGTACTLTTTASKNDYIFYFVYSSSEILLSCMLNVSMLDTPANDNFAMSAVG